MAQVTSSKSLGPRQSAEGGPSQVAHRSKVGTWYWSHLVTFMDAMRKGILYHLILLRQTSTDFSYLFHELYKQQVWQSWNSWRIQSRTIPAAWTKGAIWMPAAFSGTHCGNPQSNLTAEATEHDESMSHIRVNDRQSLPTATGFLHHLATSYSILQHLTASCNQVEFLFGPRVQSMSKPSAPLSAWVLEAWCHYRLHQTPGGRLVIQLLGYWASDEPMNSSGDLKNHILTGSYWLLLTLTYTLLWASDSIWGILSHMAADLLIYFLRRVIWSVGSNKESTWSKGYTGGRPLMAVPVKDHITWQVLTGSKSQHCIGDLFESLAHD